MISVCSLCSDLAFSGQVTNGEKGIGEGVVGLLRKIGYICPSLKILGAVVTEFFFLYFSNNYVLSLSVNTQKYLILTKNYHSFVLAM